MHHMSVTVRQNLEFNVPGIDDELFQIHFPVAKAGQRLRLSGAKSGGQLVGAVRPAHAPSAAARCRLHQHGITQLLRKAHRLFCRVYPSL